MQPQDEVRTIATNPLDYRASTEISPMQPCVLGEGKPGDTVEVLHYSVLRRKAKTFHSLNALQIMVAYFSANFPCFVRTFQVLLGPSC